MTNEEKIAIAKEYFGWVAGCGGFDEAVIDFLNAIAAAATPTQHRDLEGLSEFVEGFCMGDSRLIACAEAAWAKCMERNAAPVAAAAPGAAADGCDWRKEDDESMPGTYRTSCGRMWSFIDGGLWDNRMDYCMGCGKKVREVTHVE